MNNSTRFSLFGIIFLYLNRPLSADVWINFYSRLNRVAHSHFWSVSSILSTSPHALKRRSSMDHLFGVRVICTYHLWSLDIFRDERLLTHEFTPCILYVSDGNLQHRMDRSNKRQTFVPERPSSAMVAEPKNLGKYLPRPTLQIKRYSSPPGTLQLSQAFCQHKDLPRER